MSSTTPGPANDTEETPLPSQAPLTPPAAPASRYSMGTWGNMVRSLLVILGLVAVLVAIVPRTQEVQRPAVDASSVVGNAVRESGLPFEAPVGLPEGWTATNARYAAATDGLPTWQAGWTTPRGGYVAIRQTETASPAWLEAATGDETVDQGTVEAAGRTWRVVYDQQHRQTSFIDVPSPTSTSSAPRASSAAGASATGGPAGAAAGGDPTVSTVVSATAERDELLAFTNALQPAPPR